MKITVEDLLTLAEEIYGQSLPEDVKTLILKTEIDQTKTAFENLPDTIGQRLLGEAYDTTMGMPIPSSLMNAGNAFDGEVTHEFTKDNACPYFQKTELCALDGRLCLYDSETFPVCARYKEGFSRGIVGLDGNKPSVQPASEMPKDPATNQAPFNNPFNRG